MVELKVNEFRKHLTGNITNLGLTTILVDNDESDIQVCFKNPNANIKQRLVMDRMVKMRKVRIILESGDYIRIRKRKPTPAGCVQMYETTTYIAHSHGKHSVYLNQVPHDPALNLRFVTVDPYVSMVTKTYLDMQEVLLGKDSVCTVKTRAGMCTINFTEMTHLFEFSRQLWSSSLCYGFNVVNNGLEITPLTHRMLEKLVSEQNVDTYHGLITVSLTSNAIGFHYFCEDGRSELEQIVRTKIASVGLMMETDDDTRTVHESGPYFVSSYPDPSLLHFE